VVRTTSAPRARRAALASLAKINLDLRVLHKDLEGFHELRTVFQTISLADEIEVEFEPARRREISIDDPANIPDNLIVRAAGAVLDELKMGARLRFRLEKRIPMGGGLGGGSSNAAAVLLALPVLAGRYIPMDRLSRLAHELGSDVPFFLHGGTQIGVGRGTELYRLADVRKEPVLLVLPEVQVPTGAAYQALGRSLTFIGSSSSINSFQAFVWALDERRSAWAASELSANDFESVVFTQFPQLSQIAARLRRLARGVRMGQVRMSGSGSTIFALFESEADRERAVKSLIRDRGMRGCRLMEESLVSRGGYQRMWRRRLIRHLDPEDDSWPPRSRYER
jgi:4-diphosphocytidyl-2-C-methyl-D-erythritol kinase